MAAHRNHRHGFRSARHHDLGPAAHDALRRHGDCLQSGGTEAVDGHGGNFHRQSGAQRRDASHVHALLGFGRGAAKNHIFNLFGIDLRHAVERALDGDGGQFVGTGGAERAFEGASHRGTNGGNDYDFSHRKFQSLN